jgi:hypothetical protein
VTHAAALAGSFPIVDRPLDAGRDRVGVADGMPLLLVLNWLGRCTGTVTPTDSEIVYYRTGQRSAVMREILPADAP